MIKLSKYDRIFGIAQGVKPEVGFDDLKWFIAYHTAEELTDLSTKDVAKMIDNNRLHIGSEKDVVEWFETAYETAANTTPASFEEWLEEEFTNWWNPIKSQLDFFIRRLTKDFEDLQAESEDEVKTYVKAMRIVAERIDRESVDYR